MNSRDAALLAAEAWDAVKAEDDPEFRFCQPAHQTKLFAVVDAALKNPEAPASGIQGLEAYELAVHRLLAGLPPVAEAPKKLKAAEPKQVAPKKKDDDGPKDYIDAEIV